MVSLFLFQFPAAQRNSGFAICSPNFLSASVIALLLITQYSVSTAFIFGRVSEHVFLSRKLGGLLCFYFFFKNKRILFFFLLITSLISGA